MLLNLLYVFLYVNTYTMKHSIKIAPEKRKDKAGELLKENVPLFVDIRFAGTRMFYFTGYRIDFDKFDFDKQEAKKNTQGKEGSERRPYNEINKRLKAIRATLELFFQERETATKKEVTVLLNEVCKKYVSKEPEPGSSSFYDMFDEYIQFKVSLSLKKHVRSVKKHWMEFDSNLNFDSVSPDKLREFESFLRGDFLTLRSDNTIRTMIGTTRIFWNWAKKILKGRGIDIGYPFGEGYELPKEEYGTPIYISTFERETLFNAVNLSDKLSKVRDIFVFQCFIGARVGDMVKLTKNNIQGNIITYIPQKTKTADPISLPLHPHAMEILNKYSIPDGRLLPFISDQRYNEYIKELFEAVGLTRTVVRLNPRTRKQEMVRLCDIASSHMARRAFVGNLYGKVDNGIISSMSGHSENSRSFARYRTVSDKLKLDAINLL